MSREEFKDHDFSDLGILPGLLKRIDALGFVHPTPIQFKAIPIATSGEDVVGIAQTGSGKTLAFAVPMLQHVSQTDKTGLVLLPTRELAVQVQETFQKIAGPAGLRTALVIGGASPHPQKMALRAHPHVIVATPGRLIDHLDSRILDLKTVGMLVLDEADRMLDMGFEPQLKRILESVPDDRQTMLFSATMPEKIAAIAGKYMRKPLRIEVAKPGTTVDKIDQEIFMVPKSGKMDLMARLLKEYTGKILIFSRTKHGAKRIAADIRKMGYTADEIHSNRSQAQRQQALKGFTQNKYRILVATDIAARGIDVDDIQLVLNFDLPEQNEDYVHRIGRTGRAGRSGKAISFALPEQKRDIAQIQKLINITLPIRSVTGRALEPVTQGAAANHGHKTRGNYGRRSTRPGSSSRTKNSRTSGQGGYKRSSASKRPKRSY